MLQRLGSSYGIKIFQTFRVDWSMLAHLPPEPLDVHSSQVRTKKKLDEAQVSLKRSKLPPVPE